MTLPRLAASLNWLLPGKTPQEGFPILRAMGFRAVEHVFPYPVPAPEMHELLSANGLDLSLIVTPCRFEQGEWGFASTPGREAEFADSVVAAIDYARQVGCRIIGTLAGTIPEGADRMPYDAVFAANLAVAARMVRDAGMEISLEPIARVRSPRFALHTLEQTAAVIDASGADSIGICFDTFHIALEGCDVNAAFDAYAERINYLQLGSPPGRTGPDQAGKPDAGEVDLPAFLRHALPRCHAAWVGCEYVIPQAEPAQSVMGWADEFIMARKLRW
ncbi:MAG: TIM barrel protein [Sphingomonadales bacterium]|nr:TIM barrel protein [Sphingomonadales bacterium]MBU3993818.1 TIM barrel protein [Alphaproteobacteria bacterium]